LGYLEVLLPFTGNFLTPVSILVYAVLSAFLTAKFTTPDRKKDDDKLYRVVQNAATGERLLSVSEISSGDSISFSGGEYIPLSGDVVAGEAYVYENGSLTEKKPEAGRARKESYYVNAGSTVYAGNITVEVGSNSKQTEITNDENYEFRKNDIFSWATLGAGVLGLALFLIRFFAGEMIELGTYEALLDNLVLVFAIVSLSTPFCTSANFLAKVFAKFHNITVNKPGAVETAGKINNIAADAKLFYPSGEPVFFAVTPDNSNSEYQNMTDINLLPDPIRGLVIDNIKTLTKSFSALSKDTDMISLRHFAGLGDDDTEMANVDLLAEIPFLPESGYAAASFRSNGVIATEYYGKPDFFGKSLIIGEGGREELTDAIREKLTSNLTLLSREGKRIRLLAVNHSRIRNGLLPQDGWLILGFFVFPAVPTFAVKKAVNTASETMLISLLPTYESQVYDEYLINTLRLSGKYTSENDSLTPDKKTASIVFDVASILSAADVKIAPNVSQDGVKKAADIVTNTEDFADAFSDAVGIIEHCKKFRVVYKLFGVLTAVLLVAMFIFFAFILRPLPVAFGDDVIPVMMLLSLLLGLSETLLLKNT
jgi:hypothetical protein